MKIMKTMMNFLRYNFLTLLGILVILFTTSCERDEDELKPATFPNTAEVFIDGFSGGLTYAAFAGSKLTAFQVDNSVSFEGVLGTSSMRFDIPNEGDPEGAFAGGVFRDLGGRDLTEFDALTFYAKASQGGNIDLIGFGNDFLGDFFSATTSVRVGTSWTKFIIPIPDPSKLTQEKGMLVISEGPEDGNGYSIWLDQVKFEKLGTIAQPRPEILNGQDVSQQTFIGLKIPLSGLTQTFNLPSGGDQTINAAGSYFTFTSSDSTVATVDEFGLVSVIGTGTTVITATLGGVDAAGSLSLESLGDFTPAPVPTRDPSTVISIFSDAYTNEPVDFYNGFFAPFQTTLGGADLNINGDNIIKYTELNFVATQFSQPTVDVSGMTHFHVDIQVEDAVEPGDFLRVQLGDFGADGAFGGGDDSSGSISLGSTDLATGVWVSYDFLLADFTDLTSTSNMAQIFFISDATISNILVDNMYFYNDNVGGGDPIPPTVPAPTPTEDAANVISIYSDAYTDVPNDGFNLYGAAAFEEVQITGNGALKYSFVEGDGGAFQVIELGGNQIDAEAAGMTNFRFDLWFPNAVDENSAYLMKLVDIPGGGPTEALINVNTLSSPAMAQGSWLSFDLPFSELEANGLGGKSNIQQVVIDLVNSGEVYIDNIYFYKTGGGGGPIPPTNPAPTPTEAPADVISIYSDAYTDVPNDGFNLYGAAGFEVVDISGNGSLKYTFSADPGGNFQVIELGGNQIDAEAAGMTNFRFDLWFPNELDGASAYLMKLVDIPGGGPTEAIINVNSGSTPAISQGSWLSFDLPFTELEANGLGGKSNIQQVVIDLVTAGEVYIDNIYFYKPADGGGPIPPTSPAPTPTQAPADVISIYSDAYSDVPNDGFNLYGAAGFEVVDISGNGSLKYTFSADPGGNFQVIELGGNQIDAEAAGMTNFRFDLWFPNELDGASAFLMKLVDIPGGGPTEAIINVNNSSNPSISQGSWLSFDLPFTTLESNGLGGKSNIQQVVIDLVTAEEVYIDNIFFYKSSGGGSCVPVGGELTINGDFETGDAGCWTSFAPENNGSFVVTNAESNGGAFSGLLVADVDGIGSPSFPIIKQANIGIGTITPNTAVTIKFDLFGSVTGAGGVVFAEFFSELTGGGVSKSEILGGGPLFPNGTWTTYTFQTTTGNDVTGGVTVQLKADCGGNSGCKIDAYFDNVSVTID